ncbi:MOSC, N-terminal beta barrel [Kalmanozyma brasiliensis GHG001]|uniref:MOSC domain-containing protein n=1 Tax=Kalmanozyma brasiliensis (strain GHG001) TaxID=1365824 RepID=V5F0X4_KALBG|nr:MOSC, N-terminal beta barrel [Kalmanozyma brasiliensis GHG001]EST09978.1 MOSC, N-terminal beta barrel [Kalmanozyma brasiliensis GHG001]
MPAKIPFLSASESLQQQMAESKSYTRISAQIYVFLLIITIGLLRKYIFPSSASKADRTYGGVSASTAPGAKDETLGEVAEIYIYPIKSCAGVSVRDASLTGQGFDLDRRWMVVRTSKDAKLEKISLREEPRLTLIQPVIDSPSNTLKLRLTAIAHKQAKGIDMGETETPLRPTATELSTWGEVPAISMYGDFADGRVAALPSGSMRKLSPSEWISDFLGYPVLLVHFDTTSSTARNAFPIFKPPSDAGAWSTNDREELHRKRGIEFQDEYPLLVASQESLTFVREQLSVAMDSADGGDGRGGRTITGIDADKWSDPATLSMARFRPNVVVKGNVENPIGAFSEDSWERLWVLPAGSAASDDGEEVTKAMLQLVARCQRCLLTAVDPITAEKDPSVPLKLLNRSRMRVKKTAGIEGGNGRAGPCFGMYAIPLPLSSGESGESYGELKVGDGIRVRWRPYELDDEPNRK